MRGLDFTGVDRTARAILGGSSAAGSRKRPKNGGFSHISLYIVLDFSYY
jgi:hypothetical protein